MIDGFNASSKLVLEIETALKLLYVSYDSESFPSQ